MLLSSKDDAIRWNMGSTCVGKNNSRSPSQHSEYRSEKQRRNTMMKDYDETRRSSKRTCRWNSFLFELYLDIVWNKKLCSLCLNCPVTWWHRTSHLLSDSALLMLLRFCSTVFLGGLFFFGGCLEVPSPPAASSSLHSPLSPWSVHHNNNGLDFI